MEKQITNEKCFNIEYMIHCFQTSAIPNELILNFICDFVCLELI